MNKVYIVCGYIREEEEWPVAVYPDQETAEQHCKSAQEAIRKAINERGSSKEDIRICYDESIIHWDQTHVSYYVKEAIFARHMDEYLDLTQR